MPVTSSKDTNLSTAREYLQRAKDAGAQLAVLPECFNCPYDTACFREYAETLPDPSSPTVSHNSPSLSMLQQAARDTGMYIVGGSVPELRDDNVYNSSLSVSPTGDLLAKHRKTHLFDIDVPGKIKFTESSVLSAGSGPTVFRADGLDVSIGVSICYDVRFPDFAAVQARHLDARLLIFPGAFNLTTGPAHWELLMRSRALDNQVFVAACSPARDVDGTGYKAWGHSMIVDPWGVVLASADEKADVVIQEIDLARVDEVRASVPLGRQRRTDIYQVTHKGEAPAS